MLKIIKKHYLFILGFVITLAVLWPLYQRGYFSHHDDVQVIRIHQMVKCIKDFQIPCRWVPDLGGGYGYPIYNYYAPLPYYIGGIIYFIVGDYLTASKILFALSYLISYIGMYILGRYLWGSKGGLVSSVIYILFPYHGANLFVRGAMGELWGMALFPFVLYFFIRLLSGLKQRHVLGFSISYALLITSHNISAMLFGGVLAFITLLYLIQTNNTKIVKSLVFGLILSLMISSFYWIPAIMEGKYVHLESMVGGYFSYSEHFKGLKKLLSTGWDWGASIREVPGGEKDANWFGIGIINVIFIILLPVLLYIKRKYKILSNYRYLIISSIVVTFISIFLIHPRSIYVWNTLGFFLKYLQFPWRFLMFVAFFTSIIVGSLIIVFKKYSLVVLLLILSTSLILNFKYFKPERFIEISEKDYLTGEMWDKQIKRSIFDYLPVYAQLPPRDMATKTYEIVEGGVEVKSFSKGTNWINMEVEANSPSKIRLSQYYFPGWEVEVNGIKETLEYDNYLGLMTFNVKEGESLIKVRLHDSIVRKSGNALSLLAFIYLITLTIKKLRSQK